MHELFLAFVTGFGGRHSCRLGQPHMDEPFRVSPVPANTAHASRALHPFVCDARRKDQPESRSSLRNFAFGGGMEKVSHTTEDA